MKTKLKSITIPSLLCAGAVLAFTSTASAGTWAGLRRVDTGTARVSPGRGANTIVNPNGNTGARANRHGADDPANHDAGDDRGGNQPGDDRGRHRGRGHGGR
jgi:hypothetical protein